MRRFTSILLYGLALAVLLCGPAQAAAYTDDMADLDNNAIKTYSGLIPVSNAPGYPGGVAGSGALTYASRSNPIGRADYRISGADTVTVGLYTRRGTFVSVHGDAYVLGAHQSDMGYLSSQQVAQAQYSGATGALYIRAGGSLRRAADVDLGRLEFLPTGDSPGDLVDYGVNVYAGSGSGSLRRVSLASGSGSARLSAMQYNSALHYCYEELTYKLPADATYVRVEINDFGVIDIAGRDGSVRQSTASDSLRTTLSSVRFSGGNLSLGREESVSHATSSASGSLPESTAESTSSGSKSSSASSGKKSSSSAAQPAGSGSASAAAPSSGGSSSKFQGNVTSSSPGSAAKSAGGDTGPPAQPGPVPDGEQPESLEQPEEPRWGPEVYRIDPAGRGGSGISSLITIYIVGVTALITVLLLRGGRR